MKIERDGECLSISDIPELTAMNSALFRDEVTSNLNESLSVIEVNLSQTRFMDSSGLGALFALYRPPSSATAWCCAFSILCLR